MNEEDEKVYYSLKMRASNEKKHISGAERLLRAEKAEGIEKVASELIHRALTHENGIPDFINLKVEKVCQKIKKIPHIPIVYNKDNIGTINNKNYEMTCKDNSRRYAHDLLKNKFKEFDINDVLSEFLIKLGFEIIDEGGMRGAAIISLDGSRLDIAFNEEVEKGVRVKNIDTDDRLKDKINKNELYTDRTVDAIAIASKVIDLGIVAELCTSDNPSYTTGYVATEDGYFRVKNLKDSGETGGRVFYVYNLNEQLLKELIDNLENKPYLIY
ncbi:6-carboxyhexanoate--CoA ligase [Methanococcus voltae]|uniref:6-carboxyhexanoate--CoA ligase n=1 Tax=Methanococcus voltae (strain ATCC BAA-1334 / A3) TaxID=456320 RepID=D7DUJ0_METV3|nr:6-carboxyhexanoate--CoA ligase [Methanococcus voltae]MCS3900600.1 6-carboxyhexanoate--CoA ligase [Methanococcus voltae]